MRLIAALMLTIALGRWISTLDTADVALPFDVQPLPAAVYRVIASGQLPALVDLLWITALQDPAYNHLEPGRKSGNAPLVELIADLDPANLANYLYSAVVLGVARRDAATAVPLLRTGDAYRQQEVPALGPKFAERHWPRPWRVPFFLGWLLLFDLGEIGESGQALARAAAVPEVPEFIREYAARGSTLEGMYSMGLKTLNQLISIEKDPAEKARLEARKFRLFVTSFVHTLDERFRRFVTKGAGFGMPLERAWPRFLKSEKQPAIDPWGGRLSLDNKGHVETTTPFDRTFSLKY